MILVDTSVWVDHLRAHDPRLAHLLNHDLVLAHPWVMGELALGHLSQRQDVLGLLAGLSSAEVATDAEVDKRFPMVARRLHLLADVASSRSRRERCPQTIDNRHELSCDWQGGGHDRSRT